MKKHIFLLLPLVLILNGYFLTNTTNHRTYNTKNVTCPAPTINTMSPFSGPENTEITLNGTDFTTVTTVDFDGINANFTIINDSEITINVPSGVSNNTNITLTTNGGCSATAPNSFTLMSSECNVADEIYISEVYDAVSGAYGVIEIYNPTNSTINVDTNYEIQRFGDIGNAAPSNTIPLTGLIAPLSTYIIEMGGNGNSCGVLSTDVSFSTGINEDDEIRLVKNGTSIDVMHTAEDRGYTFIRNADASAPSTTYTPSEWLYLETEDCTDLGVHTANNSSTTTPNLTQPNNQEICENNTATFSVSVDSGSYNYQWLVLENSGNWVNVTNNSNYSGATTNTLTVTNTPESFDNNQYYCIITSSDCNLVSNAVQLLVSNPDVDTLSNQTVCYQYILPTLIDGNYFTGINGTGTPLFANDAIATSQTIYIYNEVGTAPNICTNESSFEITISGTIDVDTLPNVSVCSEFTLPTLTDGNYFTGTNGTGTQLNAGETITTSQTIYIYNEVGTTPNICTNESSFEITISGTPNVDTFNPTSGPENTLITINGSNFNDTNSVSIGGINTAYTIINDSQITAIVPIGAANSSQISVFSNEGCSGDSLSDFTVLDSDCNVAYEIYISEVYDAVSGAYGVIEIYNPTNTTITVDTNYEIQRFGDIGNAAPSNTIPLTGSIAPLSTYIIEMGGTGNPCGVLSTDVSFSTGINEDDEIKLVKNGTTIDVMYTAEDKGYTFIRNADASAPSTTYISSEWLFLETEDCSDLGVHTADNSSSTTPEITQPNNQEICENNTATFSVSVNSGTNTYQWLVLDNSGNWINVTDNSNYSGATTNTLTITDIPADFNGLQYYCIISSDSCNLVSNAAQLLVLNPEVNTLNDVSICSEFILPALTNGNYYTGTNGTGILLNAGETITTSQTIYIYNEVGTTPNTCTSESSFNITIYPSVDFTLSDSNIEINEDTITITMADTSVNYEYAIDNSSFQTDHVISYISEGIHTLYVQDSNGCIIKSLDFEISTIAEELIIPQGFSPNNDNKNDWFNIQGLYDVYPNHKLEVYNRYGTLIFIGNNNNKWYGKANKGLMKTDKVLPVGTYFYVLYLNEPNTESKPLTGWVYLNK
ncbi:gliding motility-associated C-terminal domain-containing protein [Winogradskyella undariae]|uniref:T9SS type B sorting domain-containing protein n=1 Tax=Winogradskyella undariae TaxID=1285465 RepID=UPI0020C5A259|nr:gliding motility-associated C-terminal domain-containing protein [Winogradskyella undariae]